MGMELSAAPASAFSQTCGWSGRTKADLLGFTRLYYSFIWMPFLVFLPIFIKMLTTLACGAPVVLVLFLEVTHSTSSAASLAGITAQKLFSLFGGVEGEKKMNIPFVFRLQS